MKQYAIVTDAISSKFIFEKWYRYYADQFGGENIFLCTYGNKINREFRDYSLGKVIQIGKEYNDDARKIKINDLVKSLLNIYDVVIRVDVDEFLIPENTTFKTLKSFLDQWKGPYITAKGINLFEMPIDKEYDSNQKVLSQRKYGYMVTSMFKTAVTRLPLEWNRGFHFCSSPPKIDGLLLIHTQMVSTQMQKDYLNYSLENLNKGSFEYNYSESKLRKLEKHAYPRKNKDIMEFNKAINGEFVKKFIANTVFNHKDRLYISSMEIDNFNFIIPHDYETCF